MAELADLLVRLTLHEGENLQRVTGSASDKIVTEKVWRKIELATTTVTKVDLFSMNTNAGPKLVYVESDQSLHLHFSNSSGDGWPIAANGFAGGWVTNTTALWLNNAGTATATISVALVLVT